MNSPDMSQYLGVFLDEGQEQLGILEAHVLQMERGDHSAEMLQLLFRAAHTLKGSSRAMGFLAVGDLTHEMENVLDDLRNDVLTVTTPIVNALLDCLDALTALMEAVAATGTDTGVTDKDIPALVARLNALRTGGGPPAPDNGGAGEDGPSLTPPLSGAGGAGFALAEHERAGADNALAAGLGLYRIAVTLNAECLMKSVRVFMVLGALEPLGSVLAADPSEDDLEDEKFDRDLQLLFATDRPQEAVQAALDTISEIEAVAVSPWGGSPDAGLATPDAPLPITEYEQTSIHDALAAGQSLYEIGVTLGAECLMKSVRVFMVLGALEPLGAVLVADPKEEELDEERFDRSFRLLFATGRALADVRAAMNKISEVEAVTVTPWQAPTPALMRPESAPVSETAAPSRADSPRAAAPAAETGPALLLAKEGPVEVRPTPDAAKKPAAAPAAAHAQTIRVDVSRLDSLLNLIGELVIDRTQIARIGRDLRAKYPQDEMVSQLLEATHRVARVTGELQEQIMKTRMLPIDGVFQRMPRMVRDLAQKTGKDVDFQMSGGETELDRGVLEVLGDPLIHLLRNSVDHGIEGADDRRAAGKDPRGTVTLSARYEENQIVIEITDDGKGIDPARIKASAVKKGLVTQAAADAMGARDAMNLIFASGFSTAAVVSDISGRGVGMDIVKSNLEKIGGRVLVDSQVGVGSRFTIHLPLTLAIVRALLVSVAGGTYVLPLGSVVEMLRLGSESELTRATVGGQAVMVLRGRTVPLASLADVLGGDPRATDPARIAPDAYVVVVGLGERQVGLCVDALVGEQEVVIKSLGALLGDIPGISGATILGDGHVALIVDAAKAVESITELRPAVPAVMGAA